jgi:hypothetical protein
LSVLSSSFSSRAESREQSRAELVSCHPFIKWSSGIKVDVLLRIGFKRPYNFPTKGRVEIIKLMQRPSLFLNTCAGKCIPRLSSRNFRILRGKKNRSDYILAGFKQYVLLNLLKRKKKEKKSARIDGRAQDLPRKE